jgi:uncharacterized protein DUF4349
VMEEAEFAMFVRQLGDAIPVPADGPQSVVDALATTPQREPRRAPRAALMFAAASIIVVTVLGVMLVHDGSDGSHVATKADLTSRSDVRGQRFAAPGGGATASTTIPAAGVPDLAPEHGQRSGTNEPGSSANATPPPATPTDGAKIVKTGSVDLRVTRDGLRLATNRAANVAVGLGGYVAKSTTSFGASQPSAQLTVRVPVDSFETAMSRLRAIPGVRVLSETENGTDVTAQYTDLQAQLTAATSERDSLLVVLSDARNVGDILAVRDRISAVQAEINQLQGRITVLGDQASFSSIAVSLSEPAPKRPAAATPPAPTGLSKAWHDAKDGFSNSIEWLVARSGGALVALVTALALLFGLRLLYPVVRRAFI